MRDDDAFTVWSWREHLVSVLRVAIDAVPGQGIALRGGFCNPGCSEQVFAFDEGPVLPCLESLGAHFSIPVFSRLHRRSRRGRHPRGDSGNH